MWLPGSVDDKWEVPQRPRCILILKVKYMSHKPKSRGCTSSTKGCTSWTKGFTLVEILIVVVILGILAMIVIPQFSDASETTRSTTTVALLRTVRGQLELYRAQHNSENPTIVQMWGNLTQKTDMVGTIDPTGKFGPYLSQPPVNQYTLSSTVVAVGTGTANDGWEYDPAAAAVTAVGFDEASGTYTAP